MTEKLFNALYGYTIPIYFGDDMVGGYVNEKRFVNCRISDEQSQHIRNLTELNQKIGRINTVDRLSSQIKRIAGRKLDKCVDRVIEIERNKSLYREMLLEPVFKKNVYEGSIMDPFVIAQRFKKVLRFLDSYLLAYDQEVHFDEDGNT